jgi:hypothetical protein
MSHYKAPDNTQTSGFSLHFLDDDNFTHLLPTGSIAITDEEAEALKPVPPEPTIQDKLAQLDADNALSQRNLREFILLTAEAVKLATNGTVDLNQVVGVAKVAQVEAEATLLRSQL